MLSKELLQACVLAMPMLIARADTCCGLCLALLAQPRSFDHMHPAAGHRSTCVPDL